LLRRLQPQDRGDGRLQDHPRLQGRPLAPGHRLRQAQPLRPRRQDRGRQGQPRPQMIPERAGSEHSEQPGPPPPRDGWDKISIILQPVGGLLTALAVAILGFWTSSYLREREGRDAALRERMETRDTNARLYSELTSRREEAESALRKDMFTSII